MVRVRQEMPSASSTRTSAPNPTRAARNGLLMGRQKLYHRASAVAVEDALLTRRTSLKKQNTRSPRKRN